MAINKYYTDYPACGGRRSNHWFAGEVTQLIDGNVEAGIVGARRAIAEFINARSEQEIIFTLNTTYAINIVALGFNFKSGDAVLLTGREHNSNLVPWLRLQKRGLIKVIHTAANSGDSFDLEAYEQCLKANRVRLVSMAYTSNVTGVTLPVREIISIAHQYGARVLLDGAQTVPHQAVDVLALDVDFLTFLLHKMCGPRGVGVLYAKSELIGTEAENWIEGNDYVEPVIVGGGTVRNTTYESYHLKKGAEAFERRHNCFRCGCEIPSANAMYFWIHSMKYSSNGVIYKIDKMSKEGLSMDQAVIKLYRKLIKEDFPNSGELENASIKYLCSCEPTANVVVEILCDLVKGRTFEETANLTEETFYQIIGICNEEICKKVRGLLELLYAGINNVRCNSQAVIEKTAVDN
ncbi:MAG: aminotransferase class V-fold PLP-dependent enzyme [Gracilibacteraceae bacterium]|jgi:hypothetical protein|nr:aminotransferase class V-fold PLP-dependent enzyme [Gracilibacteraceae bacterium]